MRQARTSRQGSPGDFVVGRGAGGLLRAIENHRATANSAGRLQIANPAGQEPK